MQTGTRKQQVGIIAAVLVTAAAVWANIGGFWWGSDPKWWNVLATVGYLLFWCGLHRCCPGRSVGRMVLAFGMGTLLNGIVSLGVVAWDLSWLTAPAMLLALVFAVPLYGLDGLLRGNNTAFWVAVAALGVLWTAAGLLRRQRRE